MSADLTRRLGTFEHFLWATDKWTPRHFVIVARIEGELQPVSLAHALAHAQQRHPALRVGIGKEAVTTSLCKDGCHYPPTLNQS
jgi:hypothetical protein